MKLGQKAAVLFPCLLLSACFYTPDSLQVFNQDQARELIEESGFIPAGQQQILLKLPPGSGMWKKINRPGAGTGYTISYAPKGANAQNYHELLERKLIPYGSQPLRTAKSVTEAEIELMRHSCQHVEVKIITTALQSQIYSLNCRAVNGDDLYQIAKVFNGLDLVYLIRYTAVKNYVAPAEINAYADAVKNSLLIPTKR